MANYRFYSLNERGKIVMPPTIMDCRDDLEALAHGQSITGEFPVEIWDGGRRVGTLAVPVEAER